VNRAQILRLRGKWDDSFDEARKAYEAHAAVKGPGQGGAVYALAELHRLRGEHDEAEAAYRLASEHGRAPYPGLALLRLAQGQQEAARATIDRVLAERLRERQRADVLRAAVDVFLAVGDVSAARHAADELQRIASTLDSDWLRAIAATADGAVHLASGAAHQAMTPLADAVALWRQLEAPYEAAQAGMLAGRACLALGDAESARLEWEAAVRAFRACGAAPALRQAEALLRERQGKDGGLPGGLTSREVEVLRLMARGKTNRTIAQELGISEKTVARHVSNIFGKLNVSSRAAAVAYAFTHQLVT
jgi:DNA-binding NarL/FixJ family response regulator